MYIPREFAGDKISVEAPKVSFNRVKPIPMTKAHRMCVHEQKVIIMHGLEKAMPLALLKVVYLR